MKRKDEIERTEKEIAQEKRTEREIQAGYYLIELLSAVLAERKPPEIPADLTMKEIFRMACKHCVDTIAYYGAVQVAEEKDAPLMERWKERSYRSTMQGKVQLREREKVYQALMEEGMRILPLKGCLMKELYPKQEYRWMSDLDILIDKKYTERARTVMERLGYTTESFGGGNHDCYCKPPWMHVELHHELLPSSYENAKRYDDVWEKALRESDEKQLYHMTWEDFYVFMIDHFAKHFYNCGSGIRSVMDIHVFLQKKAKEMDRGYLTAELKRRNLLKFEQDMRRIAAKWFKGSDARTNSEMEEGVIVSGVYGISSRKYTNRMERLEKRYHSIFLARVVWVRDILFPQIQAMTDVYPILEKYPVLLPVCWVRRFIRVFFKEREKIQDQLDHFREGKKIDTVKKKTEIRREIYNLSDCEHLMQEIFSRGGTFRFYPQGRSMEPTIHEGKDMVLLSPLTGPPEKYQVVLYKREDGTFVLHRIIAVKDGEYTLRGDHQVVSEKGVRKEQMLGVVTGIIRDGVEQNITGIHHRMRVWLIVHMAQPRRYVRAAKRTVRRLLKS